MEIKMEVVKQYGLIVLDWAKKNWLALVIGFALGVLLV